MPGDDLLSRIQALNGKPLKNVPDAQPKKKPKARAPKRAPIAAASNVSLEDILDGNTAHAAHGPGYILIEKHASDIEADADVVYRRFTQLTGYPDGHAVKRLADVCNSENICPEKVLFLDIETTGLGMTPVFLIGTMVCTDDEFMFRQYFASNYSEEISILSAVSEQMKDTDLLVTFNGKTFDFPFIVNRADACGINMCKPQSHLDLLHESRKHYRGSVPNCKLQTLERHVCGRFREDDIPSAEIPAAYNAFVRTGKTDKIANIIHHNLIDIYTMADLMTRMWRCE